MPRREARKPPQPPFVLLDRNIRTDVAEQLADLARFQQVGEGQTEWRFRRDAKDHEILQGPRRFLLVTRDRDFLRQDRLPGEHGGILVFVCREDLVASALRAFLEWWGPKRDLLRNRVFRLTDTGGVEILRDGTPRKIYREPAESRQTAYGSTEH